MLLRCIRLFLEDKRLKIKQNTQQKFDFGSNVKEELSKQGKSISWLSKQTGISQCMMSYYLSGKTDPPLTRALKIAEALKAPLSFLIGADCLDTKAILYLIFHDSKAQQEYLKSVSIQTLAQEINRRKHK